MLKVCPQRVSYIMPISFRLTALDLNLSSAEIERYIGHEVGRVIYTVYSQGRGEKGLREVARGFKYGKKAVEKALVNCLT